jgi:thymidylate synthase (FAD)
MLETIKRWVPIAHKAYLQYRVGGVSVSAAGLEIIKNLLAGKHVTQKTSKMSKREWNELMATLGLEE